MPLDYDDAAHATSWLFGWTGPIAEWLEDRLGERWKLILSALLLILALVIAAVVIFSLR